MNPKFDLIDEYGYLINSLSQVGRISDIFKKVLNFHPFTFGYNGPNLKHYDQVLTHKEDVGSMQTLDYIFELKISKEYGILSNNFEESDISIQTENSKMKVTKMTNSSNNLQSTTIPHKLNIS